MPGVMLVTLLSSLGVFTLLYAWFMMQRYALGLQREAREEELAHAA